MHMGLIGAPGSLPDSAVIVVAKSFRKVQGPWFESSA